ncbi:MAG TPA: glycosyltransferase [Gemmatimonadaceae bacterium]|nr:glycosyltransferase [Gemmatimonadaceae bacterium]
MLAPSREGGLERVVTMLSTMQIEAGVHVAAVIEPGSEHDHPFVRGLESRGVPVSRIVVGGRGYLEEYRALRELIARIKPDVVHTHGYRSDVIGGVAARRGKIAAVSTVHGFTGGGIRNRINEVIQRFALRRSAAVIAVAAPIVDRLVSAGVPRSRISCIPNGFSREIQLERSVARGRLGIKDGRLVAGWVGRLSPEKGADVMLRALSESDANWILSIIGDGPDQDSLRRLAVQLGVAHRITWHGTVSGAASLFSAFDAFVLSSRTEGTPIVLFEAMDASVPIVATTVGGIPHVLTEADALLVRPDDPSAIARALGAIQENRGAARERAFHARGRLLSAFSDAAWADAVNAVYEAAAGRAAQR